MSGNYPDRIRRLPAYDGRFDAYRLTAEGADVLFACYPPGSDIPAQTHGTDEIEFWFTPDQAIEEPER